MTRFPLLAALIVALPVAAQAQTWQGNTLDTGGLIYGSAYAPQRSLSFECNTPSPQGRPLIETGDHETLRSQPHGMHVTLSHVLVDPFGVSPVLPAVTITLDGTGYRLPPLGWDDFYGYWSVELPMADPIFAALQGASDLVLDAGTGTAWRYPTDGLANSLSAALAFCGAGWRQAGYPSLPGLGAAAPALPPPAAAATLTPGIDTHIRAGCGAGYALDPRAMALHDLDRDGVQDHVLDWAGVTCSGPIARPFCGAANCSIDVFLSSRPGDVQGFLGVGYRVVTAANGAPGLQFGGTAGACQRGDCDRIFWWDGERFRE